jgi:integrase
MNTESVTNGNNAALPVEDGRKRTKSKWLPAVHRREYASGLVSWQVSCMISGHRIRETFATKKQADDRAAEIGNQLENEGKQALALGAEHRVEMVKCLAKLEPFAATVTEAVDYYVDRVLKFRESPTVADAVQRLLAEKESKNVRPSTMRDLRHRWERFAAVFGERKLNEVTGDELAAWLTKQASDPVNRHNYRRKIGSLYRLAMKKKWTAENVVEQTERPEMAETVIGILRVNQVTRLLAHADAHGLLAFAALGLFAGVRPDELKRLDWSAVNIKRRQVVIGPDIAKTKQQRIIPLNDTALAWLEECDTKTGLVTAPENFRKRFDAWRKASGVKLQDWPKDCIRHSFGSYHYAQHNDPVQTAGLMGHVGVDIFFRHYRALVDADEAAQYWSLRPSKESADNVIPFQQAAV